MTSTLTHLIPLIPGVIAIAIMKKTSHMIVIGSSRHMHELNDESIHLMVTSPPYPMMKMWDETFSELNREIERLWRMLKEKSDLEEGERIVSKIYDEIHQELTEVWREAYRILIEGGIACINIGDTARSINNRFRLFPNHARVIEICENIGFTTLPNILWKKPTTKPKYKGVGAYLGSGMLPPNAYVTLDCEYILIFRKGNPRQFKPKDPDRYASKYTKEERNVWFSQIWDIKGERQDHGKYERRTAAFPREIAGRLIRMFSVEDDTVLDPFLGTGTTTLMARKLNRNSVGYEIDGDLLPIIKEKVGQEALDDADFKFIRR